jgi:hypothetical protein
VKTRLLLAGALAGVAALAAAGLAAGVLRHDGTVSAAPAAGSADGKRMTVARFDPAPGSPDRVVVLERTPDGYLCLWDAPDATGARGVGGCNPAGDPLGGHRLLTSLTYDGGPGVATVHDARLSGLAAADVDHVAVAMSDGSARQVHLARPSTGALAGADLRPFAYRIRESDLRRGVTPVAVVAFDGAGAELDRQATGVG